MSGIRGLECSESKKNYSLKLFVIFWVGTIRANSILSDKNLILSSKFSLIIMQDSGLKTTFIPNQLREIFSINTSVSSQNGTAFYRSKSSDIEIRQEMRFEV